MCNMQSEDNIVLIQKKYINDNPFKFKMQDSKIITTPLDNNVRLTKGMCPAVAQRRGGGRGAIAPGAKYLGGAKIWIFKIIKSIF